MCPQCGSSVRIERFDFGVCSETGYQDAGESFECHKCGATGDADELTVETPRKPVVSEWAAVLPLRRVR